MKTDKIYLSKVILNCQGKDLVIVAGDIEKVFKEDDIRKRAEDEQKVCKKHIEKSVAKLIIFFKKGKIGKCKGKREVRLKSEVCM